MTLDVNAFVGHYPFRALPLTTPADLLSAMDRVGIATAWVGHLPSFLYRDPSAGNAALVAAVTTDPARLAPVPTVHPGLPDWRHDLARAVDLGAPAVRTYPMHQGLDPAGDAMIELVSAAGQRAMPVMLTVRFEDVRQRHPLDVAADLPAAAVRRLARASSDVRLIVTHARRSFIEEVHFGLTVAERARVLWDISWVWGPPENDLRQLTATVGAERFVFGTGMPLRLPEAAMAKLELSVAGPTHAAILHDNVVAWRRR